MSNSTPNVDPPKSLWGRLLSSTPVVMTVVATLLAGLSNSEMTRAQYQRALAAQQQSKVGDQWGYFQAKKERSALLLGNLDLLFSTAEVRPIDGETPARLAVPGARVSTAATEAIIHGKLPPFESQPITEPHIRAAMAALAGGRPDKEVSRALAGVKGEDLDDAVETAQKNSRGFDETVSPITHELDAWQKGLHGQSDKDKADQRSFTAARLRLEAARYEAEATFNSTLAQLRELQVAFSNAVAERHHIRSQWFFFGMLGAQLAVMLASFGMALQRRNLFWGVAATIGLAAMAFGVYVYIYI